MEAGSRKGAGEEPEERGRESEGTPESTHAPQSPFTELEAEMGSGFKEGERLLARIWKLVALRGVVAIAFGFVLIIWPDIGLTALTVVIGALVVTHGVVSGVGSLAVPPGTKHRGWLAIEAIVTTALGIAILAWPDLSAKALLYLVAVVAIALGVIQLGAAFVLPLSGGQTLLVALSGVIMAAFGIIMFAEPGAGAVAMLALIAAFAIVRGTFDVALSIELRRATDELKRRARPPTVRAKPVVHG
jgi:uncharacterized membrane protein HdeD (DUF308 family)